LRFGLAVRSRELDISCPEKLEVEKEVLPVHNILCWPNPPKGGAGCAPRNAKSLLYIDLHKIKNIKVYT
jgi:hypothetical protein